MVRRPTSVAGSWYPRDPARLSSEVDRYLEDADVDSPGAVVAVVAPHAGLRYSGPVAAFAYKVVAHGPYDAVVMVGPSHFVPFEGASLWPDGEWDTPFGAVAVDADLADAIRSASSAVVDVPVAHGREHSLEMQMPFVARLLPGVPIVPLVMGRQTRATSFELGRAIARGVESRVPSPASRVLLVASSDLSHYEDAATAAELDAVVMDRIERMDAEGLMGALEREPRHACGGGPMVSVIEAARRLGATRARLLRYADSGDVSGDKSSVVGYMAAAIW